MKNRIEKDLAGQLTAEVEKCYTQFVATHLPSGENALDVLGKISFLADMAKDPEISDDEVADAYEAMRSPQSKTKLRDSFFPVFHAAKELMEMRSHPEEIPEESIKDQRKILADSLRESERLVKGAQADMQGPAELAFAEARAAVKIATSDVAITREQALPTKGKGR